jgi:enoyl-CoA hydratase/carnithine racemase
MSTVSDEPHVLEDLADGVLTLTLNRPSRLNAYTARMGEELGAAFARANADDCVRVIIVTGTGRGFCAGADISGLGSDQRMMGRSGNDGGFAIRIHRCLKPSIAAINGTAVGVGITMTLPMDLRLASTNARMGFVFGRRGLIPEAGSSYFLPRIVGLPKALEWVYTARMIEPAEAHAAGLVSEVLEPEALLPRAREIARVIAAQAPVATAITRQLMWRMAAAADPLEALMLDAPINAQLALSPDGQEGIASFIEKRHARFTGKPSTDMPTLYPWKDHENG